MSKEDVRDTREVALFGMLCLLLSLWLIKYVNLLLATNNLTTVINREIGVADISFIYFLLFSVFCYILNVTICLFLDDYPNKMESYILHIASLFLCVILLILLFSYAPNVDLMDSQLKGLYYEMILYAVLCMIGMSFSFLFWAGNYLKIKSKRELI
jgi:hypothetical protein